MTEIKYLASWTRYKLQDKLGQRGAEMVEYALVLACVCALGAWFYGNRTGGQQNRLLTVLPKIWTNIASYLKTAVGN